jgi:site-specific DNA-methyltransferase (adenine-specific)
MRDVKTGQYGLLFGDCLERMKEIPDGSVDMVLTDPPYGTTACKWDSVIPFDSMWAELKRIIKPNGAIVLFGSEPFSSMLRCSNLKMFKYDLVWEKSKGSNFVHSKYQPLKTHENIVVFSKGGAAQGSKTPMKYYPQMTVGVPYDKGFGQNKIKTLNGGLSKASSIHLKNETGNRFPRSVHYYKTAESEGSYHPTQKPVALLEYLIKTYTQENETVLDFTMGSGSTGVAALNTNRKFIGIELDEGYFNIAKDRIEGLRSTINNDEFDGCAL